MAFRPHEIEWTAEKSSRIWDFYASNAAFRACFFGHQQGTRFVRRLHREVGLGRCRRIVDVSCGRGDVIAAILPLLVRGQQVFGTDLSPASVATVNDRFRGHPHFGGAQCMRGPRSSLQPGSFDLVIATEVVEHLTDDECTGVLIECRRLLRPGGHLAITTPNEEDYEQQKVLCPDCGCVFHRWQHRRTWTATELREVIRRHGFRATLVEPTAWVSAWRDWLSIIKPVHRYSLFCLSIKPTE